jgi:hypothetical protein
MQKASESRRIDVPPEEVLRRIRIPLIRRASLHWPNRTEDVFMIDLGLSGVFVERAATLDVGDHVEIRFCLPDNEIPIVAVCRVAWWEPAKVRPVMPLAVRALPAGAGLEFVEITAADRERVREYLADYYRREPNTRRFVRHGAWTDEG